jgi:hypothetical protein
MGMVVVLAFAGCDDGGRIDLLDTGWFDSDGPVDSDGTRACRGRVVDISPVNGESDWFWRTPPVVSVDTVADDYVVRLTDALGRTVPTTLVAADDVGLKLEVQMEGGLEAHTEYLLEVDDCYETRTVTFSTSHYGTPVRGGAASLLGRTYQLDLSGAEWIEPGGFGPILATNFNTPVLVGVMYADASNLDWIGATGVTSAGRVRQDRGFPTWEFPVSSFAESPYFETTADQVELSISGYQLPIIDFQLSGTLSEDASHFAGGSLIGLGDTRYAGGAVGLPGNETAMCDLAAGLGVPCTNCPDGEPLCLQVQLEQLLGQEVEGLSLVPVLPEED